MTSSESYELVSLLPIQAHGSRVKTHTVLTEFSASLSSFFECDDPFLPESLDGLPRSSLWLKTYANQHDANTSQRLLQSSMATTMTHTELIRLDMQHAMRWVRFQKPLSQGTTGRTEVVELVKLMDLMSDVLPMYNSKYIPTVNLRYLNTMDLYIDGITAASTVSSINVILSLLKHPYFTQSSQTCEDYTSPTAPYSVFDIVHTMSFMNEFVILRNDGDLLSDVTFSSDDLSYIDSIKDCITRVLLVFSSLETRMSGEELIMHVRWILQSGYFASLNTWNFPSAFVLQVLLSQLDKHARIHMPATSSIVKPEILAKYNLSDESSCLESLVSTKITLITEISKGTHINIKQSPEVLGASINTMWVCMGALMGVTCVKNLATSLDNVYKGCLDDKPTSQYIKSIIDRIHNDLPDDSPDTLVQRCKGMEMMSTIARGELLELIQVCTSCDDFTTASIITNFTWFGFTPITMAIALGFREAILFLDRYLFENGVFAEYIVNSSLFTKVRESILDRVAYARLYGRSVSEWFDRFPPMPSDYNVYTTLTHPDLFGGATMRRMSYRKIGYVSALMGANMDLVFVGCENLSALEVSYMMAYESGDTEDRVASMYASSSYIVRLKRSPTPHWTSMVKRILSGREDISIPTTWTSGALACATVGTRTIQVEMAQIIVKRLMEYTTVKSYWLEQVILHGSDDLVATVCEENNNLFATILDCSGFSTLLIQAMPFVILMFETMISSAAFRADILLDMSTNARKNLEVLFKYRPFTVYLTSNCIGRNSTMVQNIIAFVEDTLHFCETTGNAFQTYTYMETLVMRLIDVLIVQFDEYASETEKFLDTHIVPRFMPTGQRTTRSMMDRIVATMCMVVGHMYKIANTRVRDTIALKLKPCHTDISRKVEATIVNKGLNLFISDELLYRWYRTTCPVREYHFHRNMYALYTFFTNLCTLSVEAKRTLWHVSRILSTNGSGYPAINLTIPNQVTQPSQFEWIRAYNRSQSLLSQFAGDMMVIRKYPFMYRCFRPVFVGEQARGPGVTREWLALMFTEMMSGPTPLFESLNDNKTFIVATEPQGAVSDSSLMYAAGIVFGLAFLEGVAAPFKIAKFLIKMALSDRHTITIDDLADTDESLHASLVQMTNYSSSEIEDLDMRFAKTMQVEKSIVETVQVETDTSLPPSTIVRKRTRSEMEAGDDDDISVKQVTKFVRITEDVPMIESGNDITVTLDNVRQFINENAKFTLTHNRMHGSCAFANGLRMVLFDPIASAENHADRVETFTKLHCGPTEIPVERFQKYVRTRLPEIGNGTPAIFWEAVSRMTNAERCLLLRFWTGLSCLPANDTSYRLHTQLAVFDELSGGKAILKVTTGDVDKFPYASTCVMTLFIPQYSTVDDALSKLRRALIEQEMHTM